MLRKIKIRLRAWRYSHYLRQRQDYEHILWAENLLRPPK